MVRLVYLDYHLSSLIHMHRSNIQESGYERERQAGWLFCQRSSEDGISQVRWLYHHHISISADHSPSRKFMAKFIKVDIFDWLMT
jgi:hypothetical protein